MMGKVFTSKRKLSVGHTDAVGIDVSAFADGDTIVSLSVADNTAFSSVGATQINGNVLTALITGVSTGVAELVFSYGTSERNDCVTLRVEIITGC